LTRATILLATTALLSACTVGPNYRQPAMPVPATFAEPQAITPPGAAIDPARWWSAFGDPRLDSLVERALAGNPDILTAASRVRQARYQEIVAGAAGQPTIDAMAGANHVTFSKNAGLSNIASLFSGGGAGAAGGSGGSSGSGVALPGSGITTYSAGFDASWEIDLFGGDVRQREAARAQTEAAIWTRRDAAVSLAAEVAQAYFALRLDQQQQRIITDELTRQRRALDIAGNQARVGLTPQIDVTRQRASITSTQARLEPIRADQQVRIHALGILLGIAPESLTADLSAPAPDMGSAPTIPAGLPSDLLRRRPDVRAAERQLAAATADVGVAVSDLYPKFSLTGMEQLISTALGNLFSLNSLQVTANAAATFPVIDYGRRRATVGMRREDREQAYLRYKAVVLGALRDVEDPLAQIDAERRRNETLRRAVNDAVETAQAVEAQYRTGLATQSPLLNAEADVLSAREQVAQSDAQLRQMTAALFKATGGGWEGLPDIPGADHKPKQTLR
jgi:NodT family efflux transporter outer membrane factor (OMF) lipoprotein